MNKKKKKTNNMKKHPNSPDRLPKSKDQLINISINSIDNYRKRRSVRTDLGSSLKKYTLYTLLGKHHVGASTNNSEGDR